MATKAINERTISYSSSDKNLIYPFTAAVSIKTNNAKATKTESNT